MKKIIFNVFVCAAIFCVAWAAESEVTKAMQEYEIIPDVTNGSVPKLLKITFDSGVSVNLGNEITPTQAKNQPAVDYDADENAFYTLMTFDPDAPSRDDPFISQLITWMVGNIPGKDIDSGEVLVAYIPDSPPRGTNLHRAVSFVFKQPRKLTFDEKPIGQSIVGRTNFTLADFSLKYELEGPKAGNFYLTQFDDYVLKVYGDLKCCFEYNKPEEE